MQNKKLIKILKSQLLREASAPRADWANKTRALLISNTPQPKTLDARLERGVWELFFTLFDIRAFKRATVALVMVAFVFSSFVGFVSAANSLPGDTLYGVKLAAEKARVEFAPKHRKPLLRAEFAGRRLKEIIKISGKKISGRDRETQKAVNIFNQELKNLNQDLEVLKTVPQASAAVEVAGKVSEKVDEVIDILEKEGKNFGGLPKAEVKKARQVALETSIKTTQVLVEKARESNEANEVATNVLAKKIDRIEDGLLGLVPVFQATSTPLSNLRPANETIERAKKRLAANDLAGAVDLLTQGADLYSKAENLVDGVQFEVAESPKAAEKVAPAPRKVDETVKIDLFFDSGS